MEAEARLAMDNPFSELFNVHFRAGTGRPPSKAGRAWTVKEFAAGAAVLNATDSHRGIPGGPDPA